MSLNYQKDPTAQYPTLPTGLDGIDSVTRFWENGTEEMKNLLKNECSIIYECSYCRSFFRSVINFVSHKRTICRSLQSSFRKELELGRQVNEIVMKTDKDEESESGGLGTSSVRSKRNPPSSLRRANLASLLGKHIQNVNVQLEEANESIELQTLPKISRARPITSFKDGRQVVETTPKNLAIKERVPEDRTILVMPQDNSIRYGEMQLRKRRIAAQPSSGVREISQEEIEIIENIPAYIHEHADFQSFRCLASTCTHLQAFSSTIVLAHHLALCHQDEEEWLTCFICATSFNSLRLLHEHFKSKHSEVRKEHALNILCTNSPNEAENNSKSANTKTSSARRTKAEAKQTKSSSPVSVKEEEEEAAAPQETNPVVPKVPRKRSRKSIPALNKHLEKVPEKKIKRRGGKRGPARKNGAASKQKLKTNEIVNDSAGDEDSKDSKMEDISTEKKALSPQKSYQKFRTPFSTVSSTPPKIDLISCDEARKIDELLNSTHPDDSQTNQGNTQGTPTTTNSTEATPDREIAILQKYPIDGEFSSGEEMEDEESTPSKAPKLTVEDPAALRRQTSRRRKPTTRIFNEQFVVGNSSTDGRRSATDDTQVRGKGRRSKRRTVDREMPDIRPSLAKMNVREKASSRVEMGTKDLHQVCSDVEIVEESLMQSRKDAIDKALSNPRKRSIDGTLVADNDNTPLSLPNNSACESPQKSASEPPEIMSPKTANKSMDMPDTTPLTRKSMENLSIADAPEKKGDDEAVDKKDFVVPPSTSRDQLPSVLADCYRENLAFYTPRARKSRINEEDHRLDDGSSSAPGSSRRKQNLWALKATEGTAEIVEKKPPPEKPEDLTTVPVFLTEVQRDIFFAPLRPLYSGVDGSQDGSQQCSECGETFRCMKDGRRHMVGHLRVMRIRCSLCDAGAFFCSDMRIHLMYRHCEKLNLAPEGFVKPGGETPCMDKKKADALSQLVDPYHPGRVMYTSGKIVSYANPKAYYPDPRIEDRILGNARPHSGSVSKSPTKRHSPNNNGSANSSNTPTVRRLLPKPAMSTVSQPVEQQEQNSQGSSEESVVQTFSESAGF